MGNFRGTGVSGRKKAQKNAKANGHGWNLTEANEGNEGFGQDQQDVQDSGTEGGCD